MASGVIAIGLAVSGLCLAGGEGFRRASGGSSELASALKNTRVTPIRELDAQLAARQQAQAQGERNYAYCAVSGHTWAPNAKITRTKNGQDAVLRVVQQHDEYEEYSWQERKEQKTDPATGVVREVKSGGWAAKRVLRHATTERYGGPVQISDDGYATVEIDPSAVDFEPLMTQTAKEFNKERKQQQQQGGQQAQVVVNVGGSGDSKKPQYLGTSLVETSLLKGQQVTALGHFYLTDDDRLMLTDRSNLRKRQPFHFARGSLADSLEEAQASAQSYDKWSQRLFIMGTAGLVLTGVAGVATAFRNTNADDQ